MGGSCTKQLSVPHSSRQGQEDVDFPSTDGLDNPFNNPLETDTGSSERKVSCSTVSSSTQSRGLAVDMDVSGSEFNWHGVSPEAAESSPPPPSNTPILDEDKDDEDEFVMNYGLPSVIRSSATPQQHPRPEASGASVASGMNSIYQLVKGGDQSSHTLHTGNAAGDDFSLEFARSRAPLPGPSTTASRSRTEQQLPVIMPIRSMCSAGSNDPNTTTSSTKTQGNSLPLSSVGDTLDSRQAHSWTSQRQRSLSSSECDMSLDSGEAERLFDTYKEEHTT